MRKMNPHGYREPVYSVVDFRPADGLRNVYRPDDGELHVEHCPGWLVLRYTHDRVKFDDPARNYDAPREDEVNRLDDVHVTPAFQERGRLEPVDTLAADYVGTFAVWEIDEGRHENA